MNENTPSIALVHEAHELFLRIGQKGYDESNLERLKGLRERMMNHGFDAPFKALLKRTYWEGDSEEAEAADLKKQMNYFRQMAILKKGAMRRTDVGIGAHYLAKSFLKMGYGDIVEFLPLDGNYINNLFKSGVNGVKAYRKIMDLLEERGEAVPVYIAEVFFKGERYKIKVRNKDEMKEKTEKELGPEAKIMNVTIGRKEYPIIKSKSVRNSLISAIVSYLSREKKEYKELEKEAIGLFLSPIFRFYLVSSMQERKTNNLYYSLTNEPSRKQMKIFDLLERIEPELKNSGKIIEEKLGLEKEINIHSKLIGAGVLAKHTKKDKEWIANYLKINPEEVEKGIEYLKAYSEKGKGAEFLGHLKGSNP